MHRYKVELLDLSRCCRFTAMNMQLILFSASRLIFTNTLWKDENKHGYLRGKQLSERIM